MNQRDTAARERAFRNLIWDLDRSRCRATGRVLVRGSEGWDEGGEVAHLRKRSLAPEQKYDPSNACLLTRRLHRASHTRSHPKLVIIGADANRIVRFVMTNTLGATVWETSSYRR